MRVSQLKIRLAAFAGPSPKTPLWMQKSRRYLIFGPSYSSFCPKFRCHGNEGRGKCDWQHSMAHPREKPYTCRNLADAKILQISLTQA